VRAEERGGTLGSGTVRFTGNDLHESCTEIGNVHQSAAVEGATPTALELAFWEGSIRNNYNIPQNIR
jgi:hypothetical protein